jgi:hypothetical protein
LREGRDIVLRYYVDVSITLLLQNSNDFWMIRVKTLLYLVDKYK